jgi:hypothetical protein
MRNALWKFAKALQSISIKIIDEVPPKSGFYSSYNKRKTIIRHGDPIMMPANIQFWIVGEKKSSALTITEKGACL